MMKRFLQALGLRRAPITHVTVGGTTLFVAVDRPQSDASHWPPSDLVERGVMADRPPVGVFQRGDVRASLFLATNCERCAACDDRLHWIVLELRDCCAWHTVLAVHETTMAAMSAAFDDALRFLAGDISADGSSPQSD